MIKIKKSIKYLILAFPAVLFLTVYSAIPREISITRGQKLCFDGIVYGEAPTDNVGMFDCPVKFMGLPIKTVNVSVNPQRYVIPSGEPIGVKIYTDGVLVVGTGSVRDENSRNFEPAKDAGLEVGDRITKINGEKIISTEEFMENVKRCKGQAVLTVIRDDLEFSADINGVYSQKDNGYKLGLWVKDSTAGVGTMTFYDPDNMTFAALGHGICDNDTGDLLVSRKGTVNRCRIVNVIKGKNGEPGELIGSFKPYIMGDIVTNCSVGVIGRARDVPKEEPVPVAAKNQVKKGPARVLCDIDGNGVSSYEIEITSLSVKSSQSNKDFAIKVTDERLIEKTGGIVQGMSGSPIVQNGKLVGAVTHVFVNDPMRGYGIFIENMLAEAEKIK